MAKKQSQLYFVLLEAFAAAKAEGQGNERSFARARLVLMEYFIKAPNIGKHSLVTLWEEMQRPEFTQRLLLDYALKYKGKQKTALVTARLM